MLHNTTTISEGVKFTNPYAMAFCHIPLQKSMVCKKKPCHLGWQGWYLGKSGDLFQNHVDEGGYIAYVHYAVAVDIANCVGIVGEGEDFVD